MRTLVLPGGPARALRIGGVRWSGHGRGGTWFLQGHAANLLTWPFIIRLVSSELTYLYAFTAVSRVIYSLSRTCICPVHCHVQVRSVVVYKSSQTGALVGN